MKSGWGRAGAGVGWPGCELEMETSLWHSRLMLKVELSGLIELTELTWFSLLQGRKGILVV